MVENVKLVPRCNDEQVFRLFDRLSNELAFSGFVFNIYGSEIQVDQTAKQDLRTELMEKRGFAIRRAQAQRRADEPQHTQHIFSLTFERGQRVQSGGVQPSLHTDSILFHESQYVQPQIAQRVNEIIEAELGARSLPTLTGIDSSVLEELSRNHQQFLDGMRRQLAAVGDELTRARIDSEREIRELKNALDRAVEEERATLQAEHKLRLASIDEEKARLVEREKQLDDRNNTHARRDLQKNLQEHLAAYKTKFELTAGTRKLRWPIIWTVVAFEAIFIILLVVIVLSTPQGGDLADRAFFWVKSVGLTFLIAGTGLWFLSWLTQWSARHADAEFQLR